MLRRCLLRLARIVTLRMTLTLAGVAVVMVAMACRLPDYFATKWVLLAGAVVMFSVVGAAVIAVIEARACESVNRMVRYRLPAVVSEPVADDGSGDWIAQLTTAIYQLVANVCHEQGVPVPDMTIAIVDVSECEYSATVAMYWLGKPAQPQSWRELEAII